MKLFYGISFALSHGYGVGGVFSVIWYLLIGLICAFLGLVFFPIWLIPLVFNPIESMRNVVWIFYYPVWAIMHGIWSVVRFALGWICIIGGVICLFSPALPLGVVLIPLGGWLISGN